MDEEQHEAPEESPGVAVFEGAATGGMVGVVGLVGGAVFGWVLSRLAKRPRSGAGS